LKNKLKIFPSPPKKKIATKKLFLHISSGHFRSFSAKIHMGKLSLSRCEAQLWVGPWIRFYKAPSYEHIHVFRAHSWGAPPEERLLIPAASFPLFSLLPDKGKEYVLYASPGV
jgi:hypothetical protein